MNFVEVSLWTGESEVGNEFACYFEWKEFLARFIVSTQIVQTIFSLSYLLHPFCGSISNDPIFR